MSLVLSGSTSGSVTLQEPAVAGTTVLDLPATSGTVVVTGTTPTLNGITFPATQVPSADANTLDDYEEGTWTPVFAAGGITGTSLAYTGTYTKIGRSVTVIFQATSTTNNNDVVISSYASFSGMPFAVVNTGGSGAVTTEDIDIFATLGFSSVGGTAINLSKCGSGTQTTTIKTSVTYFV